MNSKFNEFEGFIDYLASKEVILDVICIQESFFIDNNTQFSLNGYDLYFRNRSKNKRGGAAIFVKKDFQCK